MNRLSRELLIIAFLSPLLAAALAGCSSEPRVSSNTPETVRDVAVSTAARTPTPDFLEAVGTVRAAQTSEIASQLMGNLTEVRVREGDHVQTGQVLATIDEAQPRAALEQATAALSAARKEVTAAESQFVLAETTLKRYQQLYDKKSVSPQEYDEVKARHEAAEARRDAARAVQDQAAAALTQARTSLSFAQIRAPFAGVITEKKADAGTLAAPGMILFTMEDSRRYRLEADVDESAIQFVHTGATVPTLLDALGTAEFPGRVSQIVPAADPASRSFLVKIDLPADPRLRSGLFGRARLLRASRMALQIPSSAVVGRGQLCAVFVVGNNRIAQLRYVALGQIIGENVEVLSGLQEGEQYVAAPGPRELRGKQIVPQP